MSSSRARSRFAVVAATVPLVAAGGVLVSPASASTATVTPYHSIGADNKVGPNAGFRNPAQGIRGNTAVLKIDVDSASASLDKVDLRLSGYPTGPAIVPDRDFAQTDGFAIYKDVSAGANNTPGDADGNFDAIDFAQGPVSTGYTLGSPTAGQIPIRVAIDGLRATGSTRYFVTVHPGNSAGSTENRDFMLTLPANGVRFGDTTTGPEQGVSTPKLTIDSKAPVQPVSTSFTAVNRPPLERQAAPAKEDAFLVNAVENNDPDKTLVFLNDGNNVAETNFLRRADGTPAIAVVPTATSEISIGDGTGITATNKIARNNQVSDDVFVRAFDTLGNLTPAVRLFDNRLGTGDTADRSIDVTAPPHTQGAVDLHDGTNAHLGINIANVASVPNRIAYSNASTTASPHNYVAAAESRMVVTAGGALSTDPADATPWASVATNATNNPSPLVTRVNATGVGTTGSLFTIQARLLDSFGNASETWKSASTYLKDIVPPSLTSVSFVSDDGSDGIGEAGDKVRATFSEPMRKATIAETGPSNPCGPAATHGSCVNYRLTFPDGGISWGSNPTVQWSADLTSVVITLGPTDSDPNTRLPRVNDKVRAASGVTDSVGNSASDPTLSDRFIGSAPPIPLDGSVTTADLGGRNLYNQGRDGYLDRVTVVFPIPLENSATSVPANKDNFEIRGSDVRKPTAVTVNSSTSFTLTFDGVIGSGEMPAVVYTQPATDGLRAGGVAVPSFTKVAVDTAPPAAQLVTTADTTADGKIDRLIVKYSEPIVHDPANQSSNSYRVYGYENYPTCAPLITPGNTSAQGDPANVVQIILCPSANQDTAATPTATTANGYRPEDTRDDPVTVDENEGNVSPNGWSTGVNDTPSVFNRVLDKAPPVILSRTTRDLNSDGRIDAIDVVTGETLDGFSIENARFIVTGRTITSIDILGSTGVRINIEPIPAGLAGDTDAKPTVQYTGGPNGGLLDASDQRNPVRPDAAPVAPGDGAGPAITGACAGTPTNNGKCPIDTAADDKLNVFFSEAVTDLQNTDFAVEQPTGANKATTAIAPAADNKSATLTLANNAIDPAKDAAIRFTGAGAVKDASTPAQGNTQTASITAPAPPKVEMNLSCPIAASAGYCGASSINTGAVATAGLVRFWRLATTARTTTTPDSEYSTTVPSTYPPAGSILPEGPLTLFLSGKDDFGRLSTEISKSITILKAPTLNSILFKNPSLGPSNGWAKSDTMMDGDSVRAEAKAFSSDVDKWTQNGTCLANHMSVDYRGITGVTSGTTNSAVAPFSCDLNTATAPDSRNMEFPFVKVTGTTKFPVGTVVRLNANDPGAIIVDGPNGTQLRRHFISANARRSHQITDAQVITVPSSLMNGIPKGSGMGYRDGSVIKTSTSGYYYMYQNVKRPISGATLKAWSIPTTSVYVVTSGELNAHGTGVGLAGGAHPLGSWVKFSNGSISYITKNAQGVVVRRGLTALAALTSHVPGSQVYKATSQDAAIPFDGTYLRGLRDGSLVKMADGSFGVVSRTVLRPFANTRTFYSMGFNPANARTFSSSLIGRPVTGSYSTGTPIDRYKLTSVVIKVTNKAGASVTGVVTPAGIYGVGTLDPIPANWDASRA